jgi:hypothetical protein
MSKAAYESYFGQAAPSGAVYAADISYWQGIDVWYDLAAWADSVCIRTSYGSSGDDGRQAAHFNKAAEIGYGGTLGTYHYIIPNSGMPGNLSNYLSRSAPFVDRTRYDMLDFEESPVASNQFINEMCDAVEQTRQRPCLIYGGKSYLDQAGPISCPAGKFWVAHYAARASNAWVPTNDWSSWNAPLMPNQYGPTLPGVWQWSSTAIGYSLDLDISTTPEAFGIGSTGAGEDMTPDESRMLTEVFNQLTSGNNFYNVVNNSAATQAIAKQIMPLLDPLFHHVVDGDRLIKTYGNTVDTLKLLQSLPKLDVEALASALAVKLTPSTGGTDYTQVRAIVKDELSKLHLAQG